TFNKPSEIIRKERPIRTYNIWEKESYDKSWESLKGKFNSLYISRDSQNKLREKLFSMKTHTQNSEESVKKFESVVGKVMNITDDEKIFLFSHTLVENVRQMVTVMKPNSLREAIELAQVYTSSLGNNEKVIYLKTKGNFGKLNKNGFTKNYDKGK
ncbi:unnamed protein product, partial [Brachionus calyciflorus]